jgi:hypothetical protein
MGTTAFLLLFIPFYERKNIANFIRKRERVLIHPGRSAA